MIARRVLISLGLLALIGLLAANSGRLAQLPDLFRQVNLFLLFLVIPIQLIGYWANAKLYQSFLAILGYRVELGRLFEAALAINFVNQAFPSGGIAGISYLARDLSDQVPTGKSTLTQLGRLAFTHLSFLAVLLAGFLMLFYGGNVNRVTVRVILLLIIVLLGVGIFIVVILNHRPLVERLIQAPVNALNRLWRLIRRKTLIGKTQLEYFLEEFYQGREIFLQKRGLWHGPGVYALAGNLTELATIYTVFLAFGAALNPGVVIAAYTLANILALSGVATAGAGVYEAAMIGALVALGQPLSLSFSVVLVYRVFNMAVFLPLGFYFYRRRV